MAEQTAEPTAPSSTPVSDGLEGLDAIMADARAKSEAAIRDLTANPTPEETPADDATPEEPLEAVAPEDVPAGSEETAPESEVEDRENPEKTPKPDAKNETPKPSRREAGRLAEQLVQAEAKQRELQSQLDARQASDRQVLQALSSLVGTDADLQALTQRGLAGDKNAADKARQMTAWRQAIAPIHEQARNEILHAIAADFSKLRDMEGLDADGHQAITKATSTTDAIRVAHRLGRESAAKEAQAKIAELEQTVKQLRTKDVATRQQPVGGGGKASGSGPTILSQLLGPDGLPTEEALAAGRQGKLRDLQLSS